MEVLGVLNSLGCLTRGVRFSNVVLEYESFEGLRASASTAASTETTDSRREFDTVYSSWFLVV
jgi:hypothetical protein